MRSLQRFVVHRRSFVTLAASLTGVLFARPSHAAGFNTPSDALETRLDVEHASSARNSAAVMDLKTVRPTNQVVSIRSLADGYLLTMASGGTAAISQYNLHFKTDSSSLGPVKGKPVLVSAGMQNDRAYVVFSDPAEIGRFIESRC